MLRATIRDVAALAGVSLTPMATAMATLMAAAAITLLGTSQAAAGSVAAPSATETRKLNGSPTAIGR